ncbi:hypothetical protein DWW31_08585 [Clostridium sp. AF15-17LB]|nr:hypothetical protein DWW31_08585 [Clostridium sp. AF15-17LB]
MYLVNDIIIFLFILVLIYNLYKNKYGNAIIVSMVAYFIMPVLKIGEAGINSAYVITGVIGIWMFCNIISKKEGFNKLEIIYITGSCLSIAVIALSWILQKNYAASHIIHFMGAVQYVLGILSLSVLYKKASNDDIKYIIKKSIEIAVAWNFVIVILQMFTAKAGIVITKMLYTYPGKDAAISVTAENGRFLRAFGAFYSPTMTGGFCLLVLAVIFVFVLADVKWKNGLAVLFMTLFVGLFAFSKAVIIGVFLLWGVSIFMLLLLKRHLKFKRAGVILAEILLAFLLVGIIGNSIDLSGQVRYYFGKVFSPFSSFETRYGSSETENKKPGGSVKVEKEEGNLERTIEVIKENPIIGVGPAAVEGEFVGDSQYIVSLHDGGVVNLLIYILMYFTFFVYAWKTKNIYKIIIIFTIAVEGVFIPVFSGAFAIPFVAVLLLDNGAKKKDLQEAD